MKFLLFGIGNPGAEYEFTRHNIGFMCLDNFFSEHKKKEDQKFELSRHAERVSISLKGRTVILIKPTTYVNLSGKAYRYWLEKENIPVENSMVIVDDLALPFGTLRLRAKGSDAGHNGLKDINTVMGNTNYPRLRFGIGAEFSKGKQIDYVLSPFSKEETEQLPALFKQISATIQTFIFRGVKEAMNEHN